MNETSKAPARRRRRKRNLSLYYIMIFIIAVIILYILSRTVLFKVTEYVVTGNQRYSAAQILTAGNLSTGKSMYSINTEKAEDRIRETLIYVESISVRRSLPDKMVVTVEEAEPFACLQYENSRYAVISRSGRYLETEQPNAREELIQLYGLEPKDVALGKSLQSEDEYKLTILWELLDTIDEVCPGSISYINLTDRTDILMGYGERLDIEFGSSQDYEYKLKYIKAVIDELDVDKPGRLIYHSKQAGISFVTDDDLAIMEEEIRRRAEQQQVNQDTAGQPSGEPDNKPEG